MIEHDFDIYRRHYYWFQFNFFLRSWKESHSDKLLRFMFDLYMDNFEVHWRWELKERGEQPSTVVKRPPRGMKQSEALHQLSYIKAAEPVKSFAGNAWLPRVATKKSIRCRFMLFDWLRSRNNKIWVNFDSLYRALIVFDLHKKGKTFFEIAQCWGADDKSLFEMEEHRLLTEYETVIRKVLGVSQNKETFNSYSPRFFRYSGHDRHDQNQEVRLSAIKIKQYYEHALKLIELTKKGQFRTLALFPPPKH